MSSLLAVTGESVNTAQEDGLTPLHNASAQGHAAVVFELLAHPTINFNPRTTRKWECFPAGSTPLWIARHLGHHGIAALLEARGGVV